MWAWSLSCVLLFLREGSTCEDTTPARAGWCKVVSHNSTRHSWESPSEKTQLRREISLCSWEGELMWKVLRVFEERDGYLNCSSVKLSYCFPSVPQMRPYYSHWHLQPQSNMEVCFWHMLKCLYIPLVDVASTEKLWQHMLQTWVQALQAHGIQINKYINK